MHLPNLREWAGYLACYLFLLICFIALGSIIVSNMAYPVLLLTIVVLLLNNISHK
jgi:hypothetical protein